MDAPVFALYLQHGDRRQAESVEAIKRVARRTFPSRELRVTVVDNAVEPSVVRKLDDVVTLVGGDNSCREFSGWDHGLAWLRGAQQVPDGAVFLLANDTFLGDPEAADFFRLEPRWTERQLARGALLGHVDGFAFSSRLLGLELRRWVKSNFLLCRSSSLRRLTPFTLPHADDVLFSPDPRQFFREDVDLSPAYQATIKGFLQGEANPALWRWHSARPFDRENVAFFRLKTRAILCEHALSARAARLGLPVVDIARPRVVSKEARHRLRLLLYLTGAYRLVPRFRQRFTRSASGA
jgi:hypothetical protein